MQLLLLIFQCRNVKSLLFVPIILKLKKELYDGAGVQVQFVLEGIFPLSYRPDGSTATKELYDERSVIVLQRMHNMGLITTRGILRMKYEDCNQQYLPSDPPPKKDSIPQRFQAMFEWNNYFSKHRFRFLVKFYPEWLIGRHKLSSPAVSVFLHLATKY